MQFPSKTMALFAITSLSLSTMAMSRDVDPSSLFANTNQSIPCENNPNISPSLQVCTFERSHVRYYRIDTHDGRRVRLAIVDGDMEVLPIGHETVRIALSNTAAPASGIETMVYRDASLEIDELVDQHNQLTWVVRPLRLHIPRISQDVCSSADCGGNHMQTE